MQKSIKLTLQIAVLYGIYKFGEWIQVVMNLFVPGSVIGLILLFIALQTNLMNVRWIEEGASFFVRHLTLFFIPATVGIMEYYDVFEGKGVLLIFIVLVSTILVMGSAGFISQWMIKRKEWNHD
ncbi:CidA/LrgA family protein [Virgibacillus ihumii]|uniref:CidA/LrgA family protein n=1 Tax=Virgibacillus ihumii TaxID=2686091 RepID=UPI001FE4AB39|nr:CidA/LrgA family protein [Virgibacillus ihumii]